tara:strand:- start:310 stop:453 length:144 start_codon:yes stop_codon:yes gene_type:complete
MKQEIKLKHFERLLKENRLSKCTIDDILNCNCLDCKELRESNGIYEK